MSDTILSKVLEHARERPGEPALAYGDETISYSSLAGKVAGAAAFLRRSGVQEGDRVLLAASSVEPAFVYGYLACHAVGALAVPVETKIAAARRERIAADCEPRLSFLESGSPLAQALSALDVAPGDPGALAAPASVRADIVYTTGSTGMPKGVIQTHAGIASFALGRRDAIGAGAADRVVIPVPLSHGYGLCRLRASLFHGGTAILVPGFLFPRNIFNALERHQATGLACVPSGFAALFQLSGDALGAHGRSLRYVETATAPLHPAQRRRLLSLLPQARLYNTYGMTETTSTIAYHPMADDKEPEGVVGRLIAGMEARFVDAEGGEVEPGRLGDLQLRGGSVMEGYWRDEGRTRAALHGGWLRTADVGWRESDGRLVLKGRGDDIVNIGGFKVSPTEVEIALGEHPAIQEAACVAMRDPDGVTGEAIKAFLVPLPGAPRPSPAELTSFLAARLEHHKIPASFAWVEDLPRGVTGKVLRSLLRAARLRR